MAGHEGLKFALRDRDCKVEVAVELGGRWVRSVMDFARWVKSQPICRNQSIVSQ